MKLEIISRHALRHLERIFARVLQMKWGKAST